MNLSRGVPTLKARKVRADSAADSPDTDETRHDRLNYLTKKGKRMNHRDSWTDDRTFLFAQSEQWEK